MGKKPFYITTTLPYVNDSPHIGHALEFVQADVIARFARLMGRGVFFNTGTDEHGQKVAREADRAGKDRKEYADEYARRFKDLRGTIGISYDAFIRTTDESHIEAAQEMWRRCDASGDIYKKKYTGLYCVGCEVFLKESDLVEGKCPNHPSLKPEEVEEENYFFKLSNYQTYLEEYLSQPGVIVPEWRREEALAFVRQGLEDFSISRESSRLDWGVPVPEDESQTMYVWFDALTNYISTLGWPEDKEGNFKRFWEEGETLQVAGKDQVRFQSIMWQAMLKSAGVPNTDKVLYHGFITSGGQKMSKSLGNVISPDELVERYGTGAARYILLRHIHPFEDSDLTWERADEWYNAHLANGLGNLVARVMKMASGYLEGPVAVDEKNLDVFAEYCSFMEAYEINKAADEAWRHIGELDQRIADTEPFKLIKTNEEKAKEIVRDLVRGLYDVSIMLEPFMPETSQTIRERIKGNMSVGNPLFARRS